MGAFIASPTSLQCGVEWNFSLLLLYFTLNASLGIFITVFFIHPLCDMLEWNSTRVSTESIQEDELLSVVTRKLILVAIAMITPFVLIPIELCGFTLIPIGNVINSLCMLLLLPLHRNLYMRCCGTREENILRCLGHRGYPEDPLEETMTVQLSGMGNNEPEQEPMIVE